MPNRHSGIVIVTCADWAYHVHHRDRIFGSADAEAATDSRLSEMIEFAAKHPGNEEQVLPHILRVEAPALVMGDPFRRHAFVMLNPTVLAGAHTVFVDGHSNCAGIAASCKGQFRSDQFDLQSGLLKDGAQDFANLLAINGHREVTVIATYTQFGQPGEVKDIQEICSTKSSVPLSI